MIHPSAVIDPKATLADNVTVSPFVVIGPDVTIGEGSWIGPHTVIQGPTHIGRDNKIFQFSSIGEAPQDKKFAGEATELIIGDRNVIREYCTLNRGTAQDIGKTVIGSDNWIMAYVHIAHDCIVGNHTIFANGATLAGHVEIHDYAILGGFTLVHQFCRIGQYAFTGMGSSIGKDVPPFMMVTDSPATVRGINREGLKRHQISQDSIKKIKESYRLLYRSELGFNQACEQMATDYSDDEEVKLLIDFCSSSQRGIVR